MVYRAPLLAYKNGKFKNKHHLCPGWIHNTYVGHDLPPPPPPPPPRIQIYARVNASCLCDADIHLHTSYVI